MNLFRYLGCAAAVLALLSSLAHAEKKDPATLVPADALVYIGIEDVGEAWTQWKRTAAYAQLSDTAVKEVAKESQIFAEFADTLRKRLAKALEKQPDQMQNPFAGPFALYMALPQDAPEAEPPHPVVIAGVGDAKLMREYYDAIVRRVRAAADKAESVAFGGHNIEYFERTPKSEHEHVGDEEADAELEEMAEESESQGENPLGQMLESAADEIFSAENLPPKLAMYLTDTQLILAQTADEVKEIVRVAESGKSLASSPDGKQFARQFETLGAARFSINLPRMFEIARKFGGDEAARNLDALGTSGMRSIIGHLQLGADKFDGKFEAQLLLEGERVGLARILSMKNAELAPAAHISTDAAVFASVNLNLGDLLNEVLRIMRQVDPDSADEALKSMEAVPMGEETVNLKRDLIDHLREPLVMSLGFSRPFGPESPRMLISIDHRDRAALEKILQLTPMLTSRDLQGTSVYDLPIGGMSLATSANRAYFGSLPAIEQALRPASDGGLGNDAEYKRAAAVVPREAWFLAFADGKKMLEATLGLAKHADALQAAQFQNFAAALTAGIVAAANMAYEGEQLEQANKLLRYQAASIVTISTNTDGVRLTQIQLRPQQ